MMNDPLAIDPQLMTLSEHLNFYAILYFRKSCPCTPDGFR